MRPNGKFDPNAKYKFFRIALVSIAIIFMILFVSFLYFGSIGNEVDWYDYGHIDSISNKTLLQSHYFNGAFEAYNYTIITNSHGSFICSTNPESQNYTYGAIIHYCRSGFTLNETLIVVKHKNGIIDVNPA